MYRVTVKTEGKEYLLHDPRDDVMQLINPELSEEIGKNGTFTFSISPLHPNKDKIIPLVSEIMLWQDKEMFFCCRMLNVESDFYNTGSAICEGELAYLNDSVQTPYSFTGNTYEYFCFLLGNHNQQVEPRKRFEAGNVTVAGEQIVRENAEYISTMKEMLSQLRDRHGGYLHVRYAKGKKYLDYVHDYGGINKQVIRFGENLIELNKYIDPINLITVLVPLGASITSDDSAEPSKPLDITSVNGGKYYIANEVAVSKYGQIWGTKKFDDVTDPEVLMAKGKAYLEECAVIPETIELMAVDLSLIHVDTEPMQVGYWTETESRPHGIKRRLMLSGKILSLVDPGRNSITLGQVRKTFTSENAKKELEISARINSVASSASKEIRAKVENATQLITGGKGGYVVLDVTDPDTGEKTHPWRILIMNTPDKETATNVIQLNQNGIGFSTTGINGPYSNAWTIDGNLVADFITTGTMLADRIRGGSLEVGGSGLGRDGRIVVKDVQDREIGYWDKTGLHVYQGVIEGTDIRGGTIDIGHGTFKVDGDGTVCIESGDINIGPVYINENYTDIGPFRASRAEVGALFSTNDELWLTTSAYDGSGPAIVMKKGNYKTRIGYGGIVTPDISLDDSWVDGWSLVDMLKDLYSRVNSLEDSL